MPDDLLEFDDFCAFADRHDYDLAGLRHVRGFLGSLLDQGFNLMGLRVFNVMERQRRAVIDKMRGFFVGRSGTATNLIPGVDAVFPKEDWEIETKAAAYGVMEQLLLNGSNLELETAVGARIRRLAKLEHNTTVLRKSLPIKVRVGVEESLAESMGQDYWSDIAEVTRTKLREELGGAAMAGESLNQVVARIRDVLGQSVSQKRAEAIARSESTMSLNAGLHLSRKYLADLGLVVAKEWVAVDPHQVTLHPTRDTHARAHGQQVAPDGYFWVGNEKCRYPGDPLLSAANRVNCRCLARSIRRE